MSLIALEGKKRELKPYFIASIAISISILIFIYLLVFIPYFDKSVIVEDPKMATYSFLFFICFVMNVVGFSCLCSAMLGKYVMEAYDEKNIYLTFSYPISRNKILRAKVLLCFLFCCTGVVCSILFNSLVFYGLESILHLVSDQLSVSQLVDQLPNLVLSMFLVVSVGTISLEIGWRRNSLTVIIISSVLFCSVLSNLATTGNNKLFIIAAFVLVLISFITFQSIKNRVLKMEA